MRIAYVVHKFPPESLGGTEIHTWSLAQAVGRAGHEVHIFCPQPAGAVGDVRSVQDSLLLWRPPASGDAQREGPARQFWHTFRNGPIERAFERFLREVQPDLVHFQHVQGVSARLIGLAGSAGSMQPRPRLLTLHDYWYFCANSQLVRPDRRVCVDPRLGWDCVDCATARADLGWLRVLRPLVALPLLWRNRYLRRMLRQIDFFIAPSEFLKAIYVGRGLPEERVRVVENGIDLERLRSHSLQLPAPPARPHFGFVGALAWQKGVHVLIEAFNRLGTEGALTIYGDPSLFPDYVAQLRAATRHPHMRFGGPLPHTEVGAALEQLDYLVVPSLWYENSPLVVQEAYAYGVPVVASQLGALPEKVLDGRTGRLFEPGDSADLARVLSELVADHKTGGGQRKALAAGICLAPTVEQQAAEVIGIYEQLLTNGRR
jgi:glycosyltransferase involved in cell wall biosynthesis